MVFFLMIFTYIRYLDAGFNKKNHMNSQYTLTCCWIRSSCEIRSSLRWRFSSRMRVASRPLKLKQRNMMIFHRSYYTKNAVYLNLLKFWLRKDSKLKEMYLDTFNWEKNLLGSLFSQKKAYFVNSFHKNISKEGRYHNISRIGI